MGSILSGTPISPRYPKEELGFTLFRHAEYAAVCHHEKIITDSFLAGS